MTTETLGSNPEATARDDSEWLQWLPGERVAIRIPSTRTQGRYTVLEVEAMQQSGPPLHIHHNEDEHFIVLEGTVRIVCGDRSADVTPGTGLTVPRGSPHAWANLSGSPVRMLAVFSPGGIEGFFRELAAVDKSGIESVATAYGCSMVGPPLYD
jgi:mannose-6-phosphate isomerase-like protein (cupin superfamily)